MSLPNPSESERPFYPLEELVLQAVGRRGGGVRNRTERIPMLCARDGTPLAEEVTGSKRPDIIGPGQLVLGWWVRWGGRDGDWEWKGGGWRIFYHRPVLTSITLVFFKSICSAHSPCGIKRPTISKFWSYSTNEKKHKKDVFCLYWLTNSESL
jgi:hypothetical protein